MAHSSAHRFAECRSVQAKAQAQALRSKIKTITAKQRQQVTPHPSLPPRPSPPSASTPHQHPPTTQATTRARTIPSISVAVGTALLCFQTEAEADDEAAQTGPEGTPSPTPRHCWVQPPTHRYWHGALRTELS